MNERCGNCRYYLSQPPRPPGAVESAERGDCRRHPPSRGGWHSETTPGNWCGEWSPVPEPEPESDPEPSVLFAIQDFALRLAELGDDCCVRKIEVEAGAYHRLFHEAVISSRLPGNHWVGGYPPRSLEVATLVGLVRVEKFPDGQND